MPNHATATEDVLFHSYEDTGGQRGIGVVTLNRPAQRNALTFQMYTEIARICSELDAGAPIKVLIITGAGDKAFAAGTDIAAFRDFKSGEDALAYEAEMDRVMGAIETCRVPTIAAISGACTGGGAAIAACCDLRIATNDMKFGFPIARTLGNCLSIANLARVSALIGAGRAKSLLMTAELMDTDAADAAGLLHQRVATHDALMPAAFACAAKLQNLAPITLSATKEAFSRLRLDGAGADGRDLIVKAYRSQDFQEGLEAFLAKRKPVWTGQ